MARESILQRARPLDPVLPADVKRYFFRTYRLLTAVNYWLHRRFTRAGFLALWSLVFAGVLGIDTKFTMAYQALVLVLFLLIASVIWGLVSRARFTGRRILPRYGTVGVPLYYRVVIRNETRRAQRSLTLLENFADPRPGLQQFAETPEPGEENRNWFDRACGFYRWGWLLAKNIGADIPPLALPAIPAGGEVDARHELMPRKRGTLRLTGMTVAWPDPFGLFRSWRKIKCPQALLILPRRYPIPPLRLPGTMKYQPGGVALALSVGQSEEFVSLRDYRPGDPLRHIHWKSWAKAGKPIIKEFQDEFFSRYALVLDTFSAVGEGDVFEEAVSVAASFACTIPEEDSLLDLMFVGPQAVCFTAGRGLAHPENILATLAAVSVCRDKPFAALERLVIEHSAAVSSCICVFLAWDEVRQRLVKELQMLDIPVIVLVVTAAGEAQGEAADLGPLAAHPERLHRLVVGKVKEALARL